MHGILCFGDSITFGRGEIPNIGWAGRLKREFEPKGEHNAVFNLGIPGDDTTYILERFITEADARVDFIWPDDKFLILIAIGINDSRFIGIPDNKKPNTSEKDFENNISKLINQAKKYPTKLAFIGLTPVDETLVCPFEDTEFNNKRVNEFNNIIKEKCKENNALFLDLFNKMKKEDYKKYLFDGLHPNEKGYDFMYKEIKNFLDKNKLLD